MYTMIDSREGFPSDTQELLNWMEAEQAEFESEYNAYLEATNAFENWVAALEASTSDNWEDYETPLPYNPRYDFSDEPSDEEKYINHVNGIR